MTALEPRTTKRSFYRRLIHFALSIAFLFVLTPASMAQSLDDLGDPPPLPTASPTPTPNNAPEEAGLPSAQMQKLMDMIRTLVPYMRRQVEAPLIRKFKLLAIVLVSIVLLFSFIKILRENEGASTDLYYWFGRVVFCLALFALAPSAISALYKIGRTFTIPIEPMIAEKREAFNDQYYSFVHRTFLIKDENGVFREQSGYIAPGEDGWVGVFTNHESSDGKVNGLKSIEDATNLSTWSMAKLLFGLNLARGILQAGEIFLLVLSGFIMIGLRLAAPFMVAVAIDKKLAERVSYPFIWGTVVFTLIFPVVRDTLIFIAYTIGSFGLSLYDGAAPYKIDEQTAQIIKNNAYDPTFVIIVTLCIMLISGLMLWASPYLAYRIATGQVFEAVSGTASGWMAAMIGSAVEFTGLKAGASLQRQAENTQTQGGYQAEMTRAKGSLEAGNIGANARQISAHAGIESGRVAALGQIHAGAQTGRAMAVGTANFTIMATRAQIGDTNRQMWARTGQNIQQTQVNAGAESHRIATESNAQKTENWAGATSAVPILGTAITQPQYRNGANTARTRGLNYANITQANNTMNNEMGTAKTVEGSQFSYRSDMETATKQQLATNIAGINEGEGIAAGAANKGASIAHGGVNKAYKLEVQSNEVQFGSTTAAAGQIKDANIEASRLRELSTLVTGVARDMDRRIEEGIRQRY